MVATTLCASMVFPSSAWAYTPVTPPGWSNVTGCVRQLYLFPNDGLTPPADESDSPFGAPAAEVSLGYLSTGWQDPTADPPESYGEPGSGAWDLGQGPTGAIRVTVPIGNVASNTGFTGYNVDIQVNVVGYDVMVALPSLSADGYSLSGQTQTDSPAYGSGLDTCKNRTWTARVMNVMADQITLIIAADAALGSVIDTIEIYARDADSQSPIATALGTPVAWFQSFGIGSEAGDDWDDVDDYDTDGDGMLNWQEYVAGTKPRDSQSLLKMLKIRAVPGEKPYLEWMGGTSGPLAPYIIESTPSLSVPDWQPVGTRTRADGTNDWTGAQVLPDAVRFFRVNAPRDTP